MEAFTQLMQILKTVITALGVLWTVWGGVILGTALKDKSGPEIKQGFLHMLGGVFIFLASRLFDLIQL